MRRIWNWITNPIDDDVVQWVDETLRNHAASLVADLKELQKPPIGY